MLSKIQKLSPEVFCKKKFSYKFFKTHRKAAVLGSLFNKVVGTFHRTSLGDCFWKLKRWKQKDNQRAIFYFCLYSLSQVFDEGLHHTSFKLNIVNFLSFLFLVSLNPSRGSPCTQAPSYVLFSNSCKTHNVFPSWQTPWFCFYVGYPPLYVTFSVTHHI